VSPLGNIGCRTVAECGTFIADYGTFIAECGTSIADYGTFIAECSTFVVGRRPVLDCFVDVRRSFT
jgi:hypothetical protein